MKLTLATAAFAVTLCLGAAAHAQSAYTYTLTPLDRQFVSTCAIGYPGNVNYCVVMGTARVYMTLSPQLMTMNGYAARVCGMQQPNATPTPDQTRCLAPDHARDNALADERTRPSSSPYGT